MLGLYLKAPVSSNNAFDSSWNTTGKSVLVVLSDTVTVVANVAVAAFPVVFWFNVPTTKSKVLSPSSYVTVIPVSVFEPTIAPTVSAMYSFKAVPSTVIASASNVPSMSALPDISSSVAIILSLKVAAPAADISSVRA